MDLIEIEFMDIAEIKLMYKKLINKKHELMQEIYIARTELDEILEAIDLIEETLGITSYTN